MATKNFAGGMQKVGEVSRAQSNRIMLRRRLKQGGDNVAGQKAGPGIEVKVIDLAAALGLSGKSETEM